MQILQRRANEYRQRAEIAESALNRIENRKGCFSIGQTARALQLGYGDITLFKKLRAMGILNLDNSPRQEQINAGRFTTQCVNTIVSMKEVTRVTGKGLVYLAKKFATEIDESISPDFD